MPELIHIFTTFSLGLFAGALLTEACVLVPFWRRMEPAEFFRLHALFGPVLFRYFAPLTAIAVTLAILSALVAWVTTGLNINRIFVASIGITVLAIFFGYFASANRKFADRAISEAELPVELGKWAVAHWLRTILVVCAFLTSIVA